MLRFKKLSEEERKFLNVIEKYDLELLCLRAISVIFGDIGDTESLVRTSAFLTLLHKNVVFMDQVILERRKLHKYSPGVYSERTLTEIELRDMVKHHKVWSCAESVPTALLSGEMGLNIAICLLEFLVDREVFSVVVSKSDKRIGKGEDIFVLKSKSYLEPKFDVEFMPHASKLPMICEPIPWSVKGVGDLPELGDLVGGYLNPGTYNMSLPFKLLTTKERCRTLLCAIHECGVV